MFLTKMVCIERLASGSCGNLSMRTAAPLDLFAARFPLRFQTSSGSLNFSSCEHPATPLQQTRATNHASFEISERKNRRVNVLQETCIKNASLLARCSHIDRAFSVYDRRVASRCCSAART
jgi:hypothetical protein